MNTSVNGTIGSTGFTPVIFPTTTNPVDLGFPDRLGRIRRQGADIWNALVKARRERRQLRLMEQVYRNKHIGGIDSIHDHRTDARFFLG